MKTIKLSILLVATTMMLWSCNGTKKIDETKTIFIVIDTDLGTIKAKLYNETPLHRDNFIENIKNGAYEGAIFHRVIEHFMIQGGDPATSDKIGKDSTLLQKFEYTVPAEFVDTIIHKKGVLAAARMPDNVNPEKESSSTQFYIVQGKKFISEELEMMEQYNWDEQKNSAVNSFILNIADKQIEQGIQPNLQQIYIEMSDTIEKIKQSIPQFQYSNKQKEVYTTFGGTPHLDGNYTVFGEVVEGLEVVDKIAAVKTGEMDKPVKEVKMRIRIVK